MSDDLRPTPRLGDPERARAAIEAWLPTVLEGVATLRLAPLEIPESNGMSNLTLMLDATLTRGDSRERLALVGRLQPTGQKVSFPDYDLPLQCAVMRLLRGQGLPVPEVVAQDLEGRVLGAPFYVMRRIDGRIPPDIPPYHMDGWLVAASPEERAALWFSAIDAMARLHALPLSQPDVADFVQAHRFPRSLQEQLDYWQHYYAWGFEGHRNSSCELALDWLREHAPPTGQPALCWGDARMANVIFAPDRSEVAGLLDWEMLTLGDPLQDLAWWLYMDELFSVGLGIERLPGFPAQADSLQRWGRQTGRDTAAIDYYRVFAGLRFALILGRMSLIQGDAAGAREHFASQYLQRILEPMM